MHHFRKSVSFNEVIFMLYNNKNGPKLQNTTCVFLRFQETLKLDHLEVIFPKIVLVIILWNVMSQNRFSC